MDKERDFEILRLTFILMISNASSDFCPSECTGLGMGVGDLHGGSDHTTGLDCPPGVVGCGCRGNAVSPYRSGSPEPFLTNPSNGVTVTSVVRAGSGYVWSSGGEYGLQQVDRDATQCNKHYFPFLKS